MNAEDDTGAFHYLGLVDAVIDVVVAGLSQREVDLVDLGQFADHGGSASAVALDRVDDVAMALAGLRGQLLRASAHVQQAGIADGSHRGAAHEAGAAAQRLLLQAKVAVRAAESELRGVVAGGVLAPGSTTASLHQIRQARTLSGDAKEMVDLAGHDSAERWVQEPELGERPAHPSTRATSFRPDPRTVGAGADRGPGGY